MTYSPFNPLRSAFGELMVVEPTASLNVQFAYKNHPEHVETSTANGGTVTNSNNEAVLSTGTNAAGDAQLNTIRTLRYLTGEGGDVRFAGRFTGTPVANNRREVGYGDDQDGFFFGYSGATFGIWRRKGGSDTFVAQSSWNKDVMDGTGPSAQTLDPETNNVYKIAFQWLGSGDIYFFVKATGGDGEYKLVHVIEYSGTATAVSISNPSLPVWLRAINTGSTTDTGMAFASLAAFVQGKDQDSGFMRGTDRSVSSVSTEVALFTIRNDSTFNSLTNRVTLLLAGLGASTYDNQANTRAIVRIYKNVTLGGTPSYTSLDTATSPVSRDIAGTTVTPVTPVPPLFPLPLGPTDSKFENLLPYDIKVAPGETITVAGQASAATDIWAALVWKELF